jgi:hypothetical protein
MVTGQQRHVHRVLGQLGRPQQAGAVPVLQRAAVPREGRAPRKATRAPPNATHPAAPRESQKPRP